MPSYDAVYQNVKKDQKCHSQNSDVDGKGTLGCSSSAAEPASVLLPTDGFNTNSQYISANIKVLSTQLQLQTLSMNETVSLDRNLQSTNEQQNPLNPGERGGRQ